MSRLHKFLLLIFILIYQLTVAQYDDNEKDKVLLIRHASHKHQYVFYKGNRIKLTSMPEGKTKGIIHDITDSTIVVNSKTIFIKDIVSIKEPSGNSTYAQIIGGYFVFNGLSIMISGGLNPQYSKEFNLIGCIVAGIGLPLLVKPRFKVGRNCILEIATRERIISPK